MGGKDFILTPKTTVYKLVRKSASPRVSIMTLFSQSARFLKGAIMSFSSPYPTANISGNTMSKTAR
jgi:hypothetical protein